jgi:hypothetical protein
MRSEKIAEQRTSIQLRKQNIFMHGRDTPGQDAPRQGNRVQRSTINMTSNNYNHSQRTKPHITTPKAPAPKLSGQFLFHNHTAKSGLANRQVSNNSLHVNQST